MKVKGGRLEFLVPHYLRSQLLRPGFVRLSLKLGAAQRMPSWAKLQFINSGVDPEDLDGVLGRIDGLRSWAREWETLGASHEIRGDQALAGDDRAQAAKHYLAASAAYNWSQYVMFLDIDRKRELHEHCLRSYAKAAPLFDPPAVPFEVTFRRRSMVGYLRVPPGKGPAPVVVLFHGTNAVKEDLHWWTDLLLRHGIATLCFDGPGLGSTFSRLSMVAEPRPVGVAILNHIETHRALDPRAVAVLGMSLGGYLAIRMASYDPRIRAVAAVSPPFSADIYWNVTLSGLRRELAALYNIQEAEMAKEIHRITLADSLPKLRVPLMVSGGGQDLITPGDEAWRIFDGARSERELVFYPKGAHDCFNVMKDLRPRMVGWLAAQLKKHSSAARNGNGHHPYVQVPAWFANDENGIMRPEIYAAGAVDPDFGDALLGDGSPLEWSHKEVAGLPVRWEWPWDHSKDEHIDVVLRTAPSSFGPNGSSEVAASRPEVDRTA